MNSESRCGFVAVIGRPNVGKSTLVNRLVGQKVSIATPRPQTTRHRILGIFSVGDDQVILVDTPGLHRSSRRALNRVMNRTARQSLRDSDLVLWVLEAGRYNAEDETVREAIRRVDQPVIAVLNKIDRVRPKARLLDEIARLRERFDFAEIVPVSARSGSNLDRLRQCIPRYLPVSPALYEPDQVTDRSERFLVAEIVREKLTMRLNQELPYGLTVTVEKFDESTDPIAIAADIIVGRVSHKPIVIGRGGETLKSVGIAARREIERLVGRKVRLDLWVRVRENWADTESELNRLGFD